MRNIRQSKRLGAAARERHITRQRRSRQAVSSRAPAADRRQCRNRARLPARKQSDSAAAVQFDSVNDRHRNRDCRVIGARVPVFAAECYRRDSLACVRAAEDKAHGAGVGVVAVFNCEVAAVAEDFRVFGVQAAADDNFADGYVRVGGQRREVRAGFKADGDILLRVYERHRHTRRDALAVMPPRVAVAHGEFNRYQRRVLRESVLRVSEKAVVVCEAVVGDVCVVAAVCAVAAARGNAPRQTRAARNDRLRGLRRHRQRRSRQHAE